jgi:hypothetical protein
LQALVLIHTGGHQFFLGVVLFFTEFYTFSEGNATSGSEGAAGFGKN